MSARVPLRGARQSGVTLVEVLVSMVIMALGLVSLAALQNFTLRYQLGSVHRAQLSGLLSDYAERVRSNLAQAPGQVADSPYVKLASGDWAAQASDPAAAAVSCSGNTACTDLQLANFDMAQWLQRVRRELPRGSAMVQGDAIQGLTVTFMWSDKEHVTSSTSDGTLVQSPQCRPADTGLAEQTCCPGDANAPAGVRCATFSIVP
ncbi:MAG: type IV pilus modification protein PilV [Burkholderiales bacterium RIFCSPHIGHO2_01_FULL_63_240]|jgi:type IV pilus assembly protein PilV|nr:MAG: type IV pilus modification protein PilV [Burkholderiales bacterium RIFCSPHIGHO2_01_FULL_63_240]